MKQIGIAVTCVAAFVLLIATFVGFRWLGIEVDAWLGPKSRAVQTDIHRNSKEFVDGTFRQIRKLHLEYLESNNEAHRAALGRQIVTHADEIDQHWIADRAPDLVNFIDALRRGEDPLKSGSFENPHIKTDGR